MYIRERKRRKVDLEIAINMGKADFGLVFKSDVGFSPSLKGVHITLSLSLTIDRRRWDRREVKEEGWRET